MIRKSTSAAYLPPSHDDMGLAYRRSEQRSDFCRELRCLPLVLVLGMNLAMAQTVTTMRPEPEGRGDFTTRIVPFLRHYCVDCHGGSEPEAKLGLDRYQGSANIQTDVQIWERVLRMVANRQMPPADAIQPTPQELQDFIKQVQREIDAYDCSSEIRPGRVTIRRLNRVEYNNTLRDLLGVDERPADEFPADEVGEGFDNIGDVLSIPPVLMEKYLAAAEKVLDKVFADEKLKERLLLTTNATQGKRRAHSDRVILEFAQKAFRRPLTEEQRRQFADMRRAARSAGLSEDESIKHVMTAILVSPQFLFRLEQDPPPGESVRPLDDYELASRLSYFLWSTMPDDELFDRAARGELKQPAVLTAQVERMLKDPKARALVDNFAGQWLQLRDVAKVTPDPGLFPEFDEALRQAMRMETELLIMNIIREDRSILEFLTADYTFVNRRLARHYGLPAVDSEDFVQVPVPKGRRGVLTHASILTLTSNPTRTSPVKRGKWILENILGEPPPPPPPNVPELEEVELLGSLREKMEQHRANPACAVCHQQMDTLGFGLEHFDAIGAWRDRDGRFEIDASGELPGGRQFAEASQLMQILAEEKRNAFCRCLIEKILVYALGRGLQSHDRCTIKQIMANLEEGGYRWSKLIVAVVLSDPFRYRSRD